MSVFIDDCQNTISKVQELLKQNTEWQTRYLTYAKEINANLETIRTYKKKFHEWAPLYLYMNVTEAKRGMKFSLRYLGQDVAKLKVGKDKITISTKDYDEKNNRDFKCNVQLGNDVEWKSNEAKDFRKYFSACSKRTNISGKKNDEHRIESLLLTEFSKRSSKNKILSHIQPVRIAEIARFQMPIPLSANKIKKVEYRKDHDGHVDIMSRIGLGGKQTKLCIMELKDENISKEPPAKAIQQGLAYATFIRELLRSGSGEKWWNIFGFKGKPSKEIELYVACVMPSITNNDKSIAGTIIKNDQDSFHLHYMYFKEDNEIIDIETSLKQCIAK